MVGPGSGVLEAGGDVRVLQIGEVFENVGPGRAGGEKVEDVLHADAHAPDAGPPTALGGVVGDPLIHAGKMLPQGGGVKAGDRSRARGRSSPESGRPSMLRVRLVDGAWFPMPTNCSDRPSQELPRP